MKKRFRSFISLLTRQRIPVAIWMLSITFLTCVLATHSPALHHWLHGEVEETCVQSCSQESDERTGEDSPEPTSNEVEEHHCGLSVLAAGYHLLVTGLEGWGDISSSGERLLEPETSIRVSSLWLVPSSRAPPAKQ